MVIGNIDFYLGKLNSKNSELYSKNLNFGYSQKFDLFFYIPKVIDKACPKFVKIITISANIPL